MNTNWRLHNYNIMKFMAKEASASDRTDQTSNKQHRAIERSNRSNQVHSSHTRPTGIVQLVQLANELQCIKGPVGMSLFLKKKTFKIFIFNSVFCKTTDPTTLFFSLYYLYPRWNVHKCLRRLFVNTMHMVDLHNAHGGSTCKCTCI